ncbi:MAG: SIMPL domain-containing protein [Candidatus Kaiserbacteria bacterium]|nr:SIMPL domain-containing protein [Candidatus Kaiserbacteria bacterium]
MVITKKSSTKRNTKTSAVATPCEAMQIAIRMGVWVALALFLLTGVWGIHTYLNTTQTRAEITFTGTGEYLVTNNVAEVTIAFSEVQQDISAARNTVAAQAQDAYAILEQHNIANADIQTTGYTIFPEYEYPTPETHPLATSRAPKHIGYRVSHTTTIMIRDLENISTILTALTNLNPERMTGPIFTACDKDKKYAEDIATIRALHDAKIRARKVAHQSGFKLKKITRVNTYESNPTPYRRVESAIAVDEAPQVKMVPIQEGEQKIQKTAVITYEIEERKR